MTLSIYVQKNIATRKGANTVDDATDNLAAIYDDLYIN